jgi:hypothetical protein
LTKSRASTALSKTKTGGKVEHLHAAIVGCHQRAFCRRHRYDELTLRVLAVDLQRAGKADGNLRHTGEVLDVAVERVRVERIVGDVGQLRAAVLLDERLPRLDDRIAVVVVVVARDAGDGRTTLDDRAVDLEREHTEGRGLKLDLDLVHPRRQCRDRTDDVDALAQRELDRLFRHFLLSDHGAVAQIDGDACGRHLVLVDLDPV